MAQDNVKGKLGKAFGILILYFIISFAISFATAFIPFIGGLIANIISVPLVYGLLKSMLELKGHLWGDIRMALYYMLYIVATYIVGSVLIGLIASMIEGILGVVVLIIGFVIMTLLIIKINVQSYFAINEYYKQNVLDVNLGAESVEYSYDNNFQNEEGNAINMDNTNNNF